MREIFAFLKFAADMYFCRFFVAKILTSLNISYRIIYSAEFFLFLYIKKFCAVFFFLRKFPIMFINTERFRIS